MRRHLVARCPTCERPLWSKQLVKLLGMVPFAKRFREVAFVAETKGPGQGRGWKPAGVLRTLQEVGKEAGPEAVVQLRMVALLGFERAWLQGLISEAEVRQIMARRSFPRAAGAPESPIESMTLDFAEPQPPEPPSVAPVAPPKGRSPIVPLNLSFGGGRRRR